MGLVRICHWRSHSFAEEFAPAVHPKWPTFDSSSTNRVCAKELKKSPVMSYRAGSSLRYESFFSRIRSQIIPRISSRRFAFQYAPSSYPGCRVQVRRGLAFGFQLSSFPFHRRNQDPDGLRLLIPFRLLRFHIGSQLPDVAKENIEPDLARRPHTRENTNALAPCPPSPPVSLKVTNGYFRQLS